MRVQTGQSPIETEWRCIKEVDPYIDTQIILDAVHTLLWVIACTETMCIWFGFRLWTIFIIDGMKEKQKQPCR